MLQKFYALVLALGLQGTTVADVHTKLEEEVIEIPSSMTPEDVEALYEYLHNIVQDTQYSECWHVPVETFLAGRIRALEQGYHLPRTIPPTALAIPGDFEEDDSGGGYVGGRRTTRNAHV